MPRERTQEEKPFRATNGSGSIRLRLSTTAALNSCFESCFEGEHSLSGENFSVVPSARVLIDIHVNRKATGVEIFQRHGFASIDVGMAF
jgi:hypothetical protein